MPPISEIPVPDRRLNRRLDSWKEIAAFFDRDERTVKRWEKERSLPVHRMPGGSRARVFAFTEELSRWMHSSPAAKAEADSTPSTAAGDSGETISDAAPELPSAAAEADCAEATAVSVPEIATPPALLSRNRERARWVSGAVLLAILATGLLAGAAHRHRTLTSSLAPPGAAAASPPAPHRVSPEAEDLYLKGRYYWDKRTPSDLNLAVDYFTQAIVRDPAYAQAYVGLADCYNLLREFAAMPASEAYPRALAAAKKAVELDPSSAEAHASLAFVMFYWNWDAAGAEREFRRAIQLNPNYAPAHHWYATFLLTLDRVPRSRRRNRSRPQT